jgi:5-carboxymethyl-2-hydroxymuconate isomerase
VRWRLSEGLEELSIRGVFEMEGMRPRWMTLEEWRVYEHTTRRTVV